MESARKVLGFEISGRSESHWHTLSTPALDRDAAIAEFLAAFPGIPMAMQSALFTASDRRSETKFIGPRSRSGRALITGTPMNAIIEPLDVIGLRHKTDKASIFHNYLTFYERLFSQFRSQEFTLIEIGIYEGASLRTWAEYFTRATIVGVDIDPKVATLEVPANVRVRVGDASSPEILNSIISEFGRPLIAIDDGSHMWSHQIASIRQLLPQVLPGGFLVIEDIHTSFPHFGHEYVGGSHLSAYDYLLGMNRVLTAGGYLGQEKPHDEFLIEAAQMVDYIAFYPRTCALQKKG